MRCDSAESFATLPCIIMSTDPSASATAANDDPSATAAPVAAVGAPSAAERPKAGANTVANTANQILFKVRNCFSSRLHRLSLLRRLSLTLLPPVHDSHHRSDLR